MSETKTGQATMGTILRDAAEGDSGLRFLDRREEETWLSYSELLHRSEIAAAHLIGEGIQPGERVAIVAPTSPEFVVSFFGAALAGAVPTPLYPPVRLGRFDEYVVRTAEMLAQADAVAVIAERRTRRVLGEVVERARPRAGVIAAEDLGGGHEGIHVERDPHDLGFVQFSSGTTGTPSAVGLTNAQIMANVDAILGQLPDEVIDAGGVCWLPLYHDMGLIGCVLTAVRSARPMTLIPPEVFLAKPAIWLRALSRYRAGIATAPNFAYGRCIEKIRPSDLEDVDLSGWRVALNGAEPISAGTMRGFIDRFAPHGFRPESMTPVYGLAEAALAVTFSDIDSKFSATRFDRIALGEGRALPTEDREAVELVSLGRPLPGFDISIRKEDGPVEEGFTGRVFVRGPSVTSGYLGGDEAPLEDGWLDTGDVGFVCDGQLYLHGRAKDIVVVRGRNHAPHEIERACDDVDGIRTGCVVAVGDIDAEGERLLVFAEVREAREGLAEECRKKIRAKTGLDPALVVLLDPGTLPRTSSGKLKRGESLERWHRDELLPAKSVNALHLAGTMAKSVLGYLRAKTGP